MKSTIKTVPYPPITGPTTIDLNGIVAINFRNGGTANVVFWNGAYTLEPKDTLSMNVTEDGNATLDFTQRSIQVNFDTSSGPVQKLEYFVQVREFDTDC